MAKTTKLTKYDAMRHAIAVATKIDEVKDIRDKAEALRVYAKQAGETLEDQNKLAEIKIRAERRAGELLAETIGHSGGSPSHRVRDLPESISHMQSSRWQLEATVPEGAFEAHVVQVTGRKEELTSAGLRRLARKLQPLKIEIPIEAPERLNARIAYLAWGEWLPKQPQCDLLLTDPPYMTDVPDIYKFAKTWVPMALEQVKPTGRAYIFTGAYPQEIHAYLNVLLKQKQFTIANVMAWVYTNALGPKPDMEYHLNWQTIFHLHGPDAPPLQGDTLTEREAAQVHHVSRPSLHVWQKPMSLAEILVRQSTKEGDLVLDPFAGTGTFLLAAAKQGRTAHGCDIDPEMVELAIQRGCTNE